jgi:hypothetical protein
MADTFPDRGVDTPSTVTAAGSPIFTRSMSFSATVVDTSRLPEPITVIPELPVDEPTVNPTWATVPEIGLVSVACAEFCWATATFALAASICA